MPNELRALLPTGLHGLQILGVSGQPAGLRSSRWLKAASRVEPRLWVLSQPHVCSFFDWSLGFVSFSVW